MKVSDVDGDGDDDVISFGCHQFNSWSLAWHENTSGNGSTWVSHTLYAYSGICLWAGMDVGDLDGDGDEDIVCAEMFFGSRLWFENEFGDATVWIDHLITAAPSNDSTTWSHTADVNGDGMADVVAGLRRDDEIVWYENPMTPPPGVPGPEHVIATGVDGVNSVCAADVDGDGDLDAMSASQFDDTIAWYENVLGDGSSWAEIVITASADLAKTVDAADVDGDGDLDAVTAAHMAGVVAWHESVAGDGSSWSEHVIINAASSWQGAVAADLDGDGDPDVLAVSLLGPWVRWYENTVGDGSAWTEHVITWSSNASHSIAAADLDGDGDLDALGVASTKDSVTWYENTSGDGSAWTEHVITTSADGARMARAGDLDADGDLDLVVPCGYSDRVEWYENTAGDASAWTMHVLAEDVDGANSAAIADVDVDVDGFLDVAFTAGMSSELAWCRNVVGDASQWLPYSVSSSPNSNVAVATGDVNGDGRLDLLAAGGVTDKVVWHESIAVHSYETSRQGTIPNPEVLMPGQTTGPVLGAAWDPVVDHAAFFPTAVLDVLWISTVPLDVSMGNWGQLLCDIDWSLVFTSPRGVPFSIPIPTDAYLLELSFCSQAAGVAFQPLDIRLTNALDCIIGTY